MKGLPNDTNISVIIICNKVYQRCKNAIESVDRQENKGQVEVVLLAIKNPGIKDQLHFPSLKIKIIDIDNFSNLGELRKIGVDNSSGELIFFLEEHAEIVDSRTIDKILETYEKGHDCIGGKILIGDPGNNISLPGAIISFFPFIEPVETGKTHTLPGYNSIYSRTALESLSRPLEELLGYEDFLIEELKRNNHSFYLNTDIQIRHYFEAHLSDTLKLHFYYNVGYSSFRKKMNNWPWPIVTIRVLLAFFIPVIRTAKILIMTFKRKPVYFRDLLLKIHIVFLVQLVTGIGSIIGYLFGSNQSEKKFASLEFNVKRSGVTHKIS